MIRFNLIRYMSNSIPNLEKKMPYLKLTKNKINLRKSSPQILDNIDMNDLNYSDKIWEIISNKNKKDRYK